MLGAVTFLSSVCIWMAAFSLSCLCHASLRQPAAPRERQPRQMTQFCLEPGLQSISSLLFPLLTQLPWAGELSPQHMGLELFKAKLEPPENLRGIPESHWENLTRAIQEGISTTGLSLCSVQGKNHIFLCSLLIRTCQIRCWSPLQSGHSLAQLGIAFCQKHWCQRMVSLKRTPCRVRSSSLQNSRRKCGYFQSFHD